MKFFDSKEEVLDIQLTKYGRHLLSQGSWKPEYYAFFDDNVLYDVQYGGITENKNSVEVRIQDETPLLRTQGNFVGLEGYLFDNVNDEFDWIRLNAYEKLNVMPLSLGTTKLDSTKTPAFKIRFLEGKIQNLENNLTGTVRTDDVPAGTGTTYSQQLLKIPQIDLDVKFKITVADPAGPQPRFEIDPALSTDRTYADGTKVLIGPDQILFVIEEKNANFNYENFDIEVFEITNQTGSFGETVLEPMSFRRPLKMVENNLLLDKKEAEYKAGRISGRPPEIDPTYVEYFFNINVDSEIDENTICKSISQLKSADRFADLEINCPDIMTPTTAGLYSSDAIDEDCPDY